MKNKKLFKVLMALAIMVAVGGTSAVALAANSNGQGLYRGQAKVALTDVQKADFKIKHDAVTSALKAGDYNAWVTAVKANNPNCPKLQKITASNFSKYAEAYKLREQADAIMTELGLTGDKNPGIGMGAGTGQGCKGGMNGEMKGGHVGRGAHCTQVTATPTTLK